MDLPHHLSIEITPTISLFLVVFPRYVVLCGVFALIADVTYIRSPHGGSITRSGRLAWS